MSGDQLYTSFVAEFFFSLNLLKVLNDVLTSVDEMGSFVSRRPIQEAGVAFLTIQTGLITTAWQSVLCNVVIS